MSLWGQNRSNHHSTQWLSFAKSSPKLFVNSCLGFLTTGIIKCSIYMRNGFFWFTVPGLALHVSVAKSARVCSSWICCIPNQEQPAHFFTYTLAKEWHHPEWMCRSTPTDTIKTWTATQTPPSRVILDAVKLTINTNHHTSQIQICHQLMTPPTDGVCSPLVS